jgi:hypothetical protein
MKYRLALIGVALLGFIAGVLVRPLEVKAQGGTITVKSVGMGGTFPITGRVVGFSCTAIGEGGPPMCFVVTQ